MIDKEEFLYNYDELVQIMKEHNITSFTIKSKTADGKEGTKANLINQYTFNKLKNNKGSVGLDIIMALLVDMDVNKIELIREGNTLNIIVPDSTKSS